jgi:hypothetical protein
VLNLSELVEHADAAEPELPGGALHARRRGAFAVWEFFRGVDLALVSENVQNGYEEPDFFGTIVPSADGTLTVEVTEGVARYDHRILYFVEGRGAFELIRRDVEKSREAIRVRLVLREL